MKYPIGSNSGLSKFQVSSSKAELEQFFLRSLTSLAVTTDSVFISSTQCSRKKVKPQNRVFRASFLSLIQEFTQGRGWGSEKYSFGCGSEKYSFGLSQCRMLCGRSHCASCSAFSGMYNYES